MHQKDMTVLIRYVPNNRVSRETKHNMLEIQVQINSQSEVGNFNTFISITDFKKERKSVKIQNP